MAEIDFSKSLQQLDGDDWGEPTYQSNLVIECHRLRRVPLDQLTGEHLCTLIGQRIGLAYLVPRALVLLANDPLLEETYGYYPGDLLWSLLTLPSAVWEEHQEWRRDLRALAVVARARCDALAEQATVDWAVMPVQPELVNALDRFLAQRYGLGRRR